MEVVEGKKQWKWQRGSNSGSGRGEVTEEVAEGK